MNVLSRSSLSDGWEINRDLVVVVNSRILLRLQALSVPTDANCICRVVAVANLDHVYVSLYAGAAIDI